MKVHPQSTARLATGANASLYRIALSLPFDEQQAAMDWYDKLDQPYSVRLFG